MRTITAYGVAAATILAFLNVVMWRTGNHRLHDLNMFSVGFVLGMAGMYLATWLYGYRKVTGR
jgi:hypothetical protein